MHEIEKTNVTLQAAGPLPIAHLKIASLVEATYQLVLRRGADHPQGARGESFAKGDLGDDPNAHPDDIPVNFRDGSLQRGGDLKGYTLTALVSYARPSDHATENIDIAVALTQGGNDVPNGEVEHREQFTDLGIVLIRFRLTVA